MPKRSSSWLDLPSRSTEERSLRGINSGEMPLRRSSREIAHQREPGKQPADGKPDREQNVERREAELAAFVVQRDIEREGREGGVAAEDAGGEEQPRVLRGTALEGEVGGEQAHRERAGHVLEQRRIGKRGAEQACRSEIDAVAQCCAETAAEKYDQKAHSPSLPKCGRKKTARLGRLV